MDTQQVVLKDLEGRRGGHLPQALSNDGGVGGVPISFLEFVSGSETRCHFPPTFNLSGESAL